MDYVDVTILYPWMHYDQIMVNILAILCSPREDGNSSSIADAVTDGAMGLSTNIIDLYRIDRLRNIRGCHACLECKKNGRCVINDDISDILEKIRDSDCVIIATPVYFGGPSAQFKILEDRMFSFLNNDMSSNLSPGKKLVVIVTCSGNISIADNVAKGISATFMACGFETEGTITFSDENDTRQACLDENVIALAKEIGLRFRNT